MLRSSFSSASFSKLPVPVFHFVFSVFCKYDYVGGLKIEVFRWFPPTANVESRD